MRDTGIIKGLTQKFDTNDQRGKDSYYGFRKMFRDYLNGFYIPFYDHCCPNADKAALATVGFSTTESILKYYDPVGAALTSVDNSQSVTALTAFATGGQASGTALSPGFNEVTTVATAGDSVKLPLAAEGLIVIVKNDGVAALAVFPNTSDKIDDGSVNASVTVQPQVSVVFRAVDSVNWESNFQVAQATSIFLADGTVGNLAVKLGADANNGIYGISDTQLGFASEGVLVGGFDTIGLFTDHITEQTTGFGISLDKNTIQKRTATAVNTTNPITAAAIAKGLITSTSGAAVTATLDTAAAIVTQTGAVAGTSIDFIVDNIAGANTVTVAVNTGITAVTAVITGGATLTVASGAAGQFRLYFTSTSAAKLARIF